MNVFEQAMDIANHHDYHAGHPRESGIGVAALIDKLEAAGLLRSDPPDDGEVMAFRTWGNNSHLIEDLFKLGYLNDDMAILDPTYGLGVFWKRHRPPYLVGTDIEPAKSPGGYVPGQFAFTESGISVDFTKTPWGDETFDAVVFDPDYKLSGTSQGNNRGPAASNPRYGMDRAYQSAADHLGRIADGLSECVRVTTPGGVITVKHMDQVVSGSVTFQSDMIRDVMVGLGCAKFAVFHLEGHRKQPTHDKCRACDGSGWTSTNVPCSRCGGEGEVPRRQVHERNNYSTLALYRRLT